jgi:dihydrofolate synthase / folylpolyglutamate synthase
VEYRDALALLDARGNELLGIQLGLGRILRVLKALGDPQLSYPSIHVAGTNGKGSVAAMAESILRRAGYRTALYTSPHLVRIEERISVAGRTISSPRFARLIEDVALAESVLLRSGAVDRRLTYFELITACAFLHFAKEKVEIAVVEVGLGGALDATNVVVPAACVITGISFDHQDLLGNTLGKIAREKAGIAKPGVTIYSGCTTPEPRRVIRSVAARRGAALVEVGGAIRVRVAGSRTGRLGIDLQTPKRRYRNVRLALAGGHQARNAALAVAAVDSLEGFPVRVGDIRKGLRSAYWPGRLEEFRKPRRTLIDGAHNPEGARCLASHLGTLVGTGPRRPVHLVFGVLADKDIAGIAAPLFRLAIRIYLTPVRSRRSAAPEAVMAAAGAAAGRSAVFRDARAALRAAWKNCPRGGLVVVAGSLYLIGEILPVLRRPQPIVQD